jgi:membrane protein YqaA with SNARE-associated domain
MKKKRRLVARANGPRRADFRWPQRTKKHFIPVYYLLFPSFPSFPFLPLFAMSGLFKQNALPFSLFCFLHAILNEMHAID